MDLCKRSSVDLMRFSGSEDEMLLIFPMIYPSSSSGCIIKMSPESLIRTVSNVPGGCSPTYKPQNLRINVWKTLRKFYSWSEHRVAGLVKPLAAHYYGEIRWASLKRNKHPGWGWGLEEDEEQSGDETQTLSWCWAVSDRLDSLWIFPSSGQMEQNPHRLPVTFIQ